MLQFDMLSEKNTLILSFSASEHLEHDTLNPLPCNLKPEP